jgi:multiple sugar transport system substrate-binding protein
MTSNNPLPPAARRRAEIAALEQVALSRRGLFALGGGLGLAAALAGCGGTSAPPGTGPQTGGNGGASYSGPKVTLNFWNGFTGGDGKYISKIVSDFNAKNPNIVVKMNVYQWTDFFQKLPAAVQSGNGPNVAAMHVDDIPTNAAQQTIVPIDDVAKALNLQESDFSPVVWQGGIYKGKRYGIPLDIHPLGLYWNKSVLQKAGLDPSKPPTNRNDFEEALKTLKGKGVQGYWMTPFPFTGGLTFFSLLYQFGGSVLDSNNTKAVFDSDAGVQALTWMRSMVTNGYSPANVAQDADYVAFKNNKTAFNINGIWQVNDCASTKGLEWDAGAVPQIGTQKAVWGDSHQFVIPRQTKNDPNVQTASRYFINQVSKNSIEWVKSAKVPAAKSVLDSPEFKQMKTLDAFATELPYVHFPPLLAGGGDVVTEMFNGVQAGILGKADPASALKASAAKATKIAQDNAKKYGS